QHVRLYGKKDASVLQRPNHALQRLARRLEMVKQSACDDEVVRALFYCVLKDIDAADLETRGFEVRGVSEIDVARNHVTGRRHALGESLRDRSVATAEFQAPPA